MDLIFKKDFNLETILKIGINDRKIQDIELKMQKTNEELENHMKILYEFHGKVADFHL